MSRSEFYRSRSWREFVELLKIERTDENGFIICAHCGKPIVKKYDCIGHHKEELTEENYENPEISLNPDNVVLVHQRCHNLIHDKLGYVEKKVYIVYGSPLSGKSSYVKSLQNEGDLIVDIDNIWQALSGCERYIKPLRLRANVFQVRDGKLGETIDEVMEKKKAEAILSANEEAYTEAITNKVEALKEWKKNLSTYDEVKQKYEESNEAIAEHERLLAGGDIDGAAEYYNQHKKVILANDELKESFKKSKAAVDESESNYINYCNEVVNYENLKEATISGNADKISDAMLKTQYSFITAENGTEQSLKNQLFNLEQNYTDMKDAIENNTPGVTQEMVDQAQYMVGQAQLELDKYADGASEAGGIGATAFANGMLMKNDLVSDAAAGTADTAKSQLDGADTYSSGTSIVDKLASGIQDNSAVANTAGQTVAGNAIDGISSRNGDAQKAGADFTQGFSNGIVGGMTGAGDAAASLAANTLKRFREGLDEHSPSKETYEAGDFFVAGFRNAIVDKTKNAVKAIKNLATDSLKALNSELSNDINVPEISATANTLKKAGSCTGATAETGTEQRTIIQNFYQTNNSPKSLSRLEIYRNTKNLLGFAGGPQ